MFRTESKDRLDLLKILKDGTTIELSKYLTKQNHKVKDVQLW